MQVPSRSMTYSSVDDCEDRERFSPSTGFELATCGVMHNGNLEVYLKVMKFYSLTDDFESFEMYAILE